MTKFISFLSFYLLATVAFAQTGNIRGKVIDDATGEAMIGVTLLVKGTSKGAVTDFDGNFNISVQPGTHALQVSFISYETITITDIEVKAGEVVYFDNIRMKEAVEELETVVITAEVVQNSEEALLTLKRKSPSVLDGISSANFRKIGDGDAAEAAKRVTGVSIEGGKYIYVRGLGDRYTKTMVNGVDIPGLDPDMNSLQIDIFPTNLIDNLMVMKTAVAEMPADFTGGLVNIETKDFPEKKIFNISSSMSYNPSMHFNSDYLAPENSSTDWLGYDNGLRELPAGAAGAEVPTPVNSGGEEVNEFVNQFNPTLGPIRQQNFMNYSLGLSFGNQKELQNGNTLGYFLSTTYKYSSQYFDDVIYGEYQRPGSPDEYELIYAYRQTGELSSENVLLGGIGGLAYKSENSKYKLSLMHLQNGESRAGKFFLDDNGTAVGKSGYTADSYNLDYTQRGLTNLLLSGEHHFSDNEWLVTWKVSPTISRLTDPDIRKTAFSLNSGEPRFEAGNGGNPSRIWRDLDEINLANRLDFERKLNTFGQEGNLKFGVSYLYKERDYEILFFDLQRFGTAAPLDGNPNNVLTEERIYPNGVFYYQTGNNVPNPNAYNSNVNNYAAYVSTELNPTSYLKAILGIRAENYVQRHTGRDQQFALSDGASGRNLVNEKVLDALDLFPSANLIFNVTENQNIRTSYSRTIARPSFKELSFAQILDPITNRTFNGGLFPFTDSEGEVVWDGNLQETRINNFDLRWELFLSRSQMISVSGFYKTFDNPIELVRIPQAQTGLEFQPRNVGDGQVLGVEFEFRKSMDFISPIFDRFSVNGNITVVKSQIDMTSTEFEARERYEKVGEEIEPTREMAGQAPYIINGGISYDNPKLGLETGLFYNVKGPTLTIVGGGLTPDVYTEPFHSLNFNLNKSIGRERRATVNIGIDNILNDTREEFFTGFNAQDQYFTRFSPGTTFTIGLKYDFIY